MESMFNELAKVKKELQDLTIKYNSLAKSKELLQADYEQQESEIQTIKSKQEAEHQKNIKEFYIKKSDEKAIIELAKGLGMISKGQLATAFKDIRKILDLNSKATTEQIVERISELKTNSQTTQLANERPQDSEEKLTELQSNYDNLLNQKQELESQLSTLNQQLTELNNNQQESSQLTSELTKLKEDYANILTKQEPLTQANKQLELDKNDLNHQITKLKQEIKLLEEELAQVKQELNQ